MPVQQLLMTYAAAGGGGGVVWDSAVRSVPAVLSLGDSRLTADTAAAGTYANVRSTKPLTGLAYISGTVSMNDLSTNAGFGVGDITSAVTNASIYMGQQNLNVAMWGRTFTRYFNNGAQTYTGGGSGSPADVQIAVRVATRRVWVRVNGGVWHGGGDPVADTSPTVTLSGTGAIYAQGTITRAGAAAGRYVDLHGTAATTTGAVPAGFTAAGFAP